MMPPSIKIVDATRIVAPPAAADESSSPPPTLIKLSALGAPCLVIPLIQRVLIFVDADDGSRELPPFASMAASLRASLAATLAGRIVFLPATGDAAIDCSEEALARGVRGDDDAAAAPVFDPSAVALPGGEEHAAQVTQTEWPFAPNRPRRTFITTAQQMRHLKQHITTNLTTISSAQITDAPVSTFVAIAALAWGSFVRSKHPAAISADHDVYLFFYVDCRGRRGMDPPVSEDYFGTCITGCLAKAIARDLLAEDGVAFAAAAVQEEVRRAAEYPLALWDWLGAALAFPLDRLVGMNGSTRFPAYDATDFGWGKPSRTELVTMNRSGQVVLVAAEVQASVCVEPEHMDAFSSHFLSCLE